MDHNYAMFFEKSIWNTSIHSCGSSSCSQAMETDPKSVSNVVKGLFHQFPRTRLADAL